METTKDKIAISHIKLLFQSYHATMKHSRLRMNTSAIDKLKKEKYKELIVICYFTPNTQAFNVIDKAKSIIEDYNNHHKFKITTEFIPYKTRFVGNALYKYRAIHLKEILEADDTKEVGIIPITNRQGKHKVAKKKKVEVTKEEVKKCPVFIKRSKLVSLTIIPNIK